MPVIEFDISGTAYQKIEILDSNYSLKDIEQGLNEETLHTTTWFNKKVRKNYIIDNNQKKIAEIISSEIEGEYLEYKSHENEEYTIY